jgi:hypothetical protein
MFRFEVFGKGEFKCCDVLVFHVGGDVIAGRHLNDDTGILLQCPWTVRFVIAFKADCSSADDATLQRSR